VQALQEFNAIEFDTNTSESNLSQGYLLLAALTIWQE